jgi:hypothetical protein
MQINLLDIEHPKKTKQISTPLLNNFYRYSCNAIAYTFHAFWRKMHYDVK